jgi:hypothetical protein
MKPRFTNDDLWEWFHLFNSRYFGGKLSPLHINFADLSSKHAIGHTGRYRTLYGKRSQEDRFYIEIDRSLNQSRALACQTLLHEMVHLEQKNKYSCGLRGHKFNNRMKELAAAGAFNGLW